MKRWSLLKPKIVVAAPQRRLRLPGHQFLGSRRPAFTREAPGRGNLLYTQALQLARQQDQEAAARTAFEICCTTHPDHTKAWVSWAQFEKRVKKDQQERFHSCRQVLQQGLSINRTSAALIQAWGLMELQKGNIVAAVLLLERSVQFEPRNRPVLKWRAVQLAQQALLDRRRKTSALTAQIKAQLTL
ncbi:hypothetical protein ABBQ32_001964 [Trebouxia sp. C0010 RCD-2024]